MGEKEIHHIVSYFFNRCHRASSENKLKARKFLMKNFSAKQSTITWLMKTSMSSCLFNFNVLEMLDFVKRASQVDELHRRRTRRLSNRLSRKPSSCACRHRRRSILIRTSKYFSPPSDLHHRYTLFRFTRSTSLLLFFFSAQPISRLAGFK